MKSNAKQIFIPTISLFVICLVTTLLLALTNNATASKIEQLQIEKESKTRSEILSSAESFEKAELDGTEYYIGTDASGNTVGYVFTLQASGYGGAMTVMSAFDTEGIVTGIQVVDCDETAGLGLNCKQEWFTDRYKDTNGELNVIKNGDAGENEILAITGATITTRAVTGAVNEARNMFNEITGGDK